MGLKHASGFALDPYPCATVVSTSPFKVIVTLLHLRSVGQELIKVTRVRYFWL